jgi:hypothetical protein
MGLNFDQNYVLSSVEVQRAFVFFTAVLTECSVHFLCDTSAPLARFLNGSCQVVMFRWAAVAINLCLGFRLTAC